MEGNKIFKGAFVLGLGTFIAKFLGAIYRIPLTSTIGGYGLGLYQMVFPIYSTLLDFSGAGAPNAISKIISSCPIEQREIKSKKILAVSLKFFAISGILGMLVMFFFSKPISIGQGNAEAQTAYIALAPSVLFVCLLSCFRGYFQGFMKMYPTAVSQIIEQIVKIAAGLFFAYTFMPNVKKAVAGATFAITLSEAFALFYLLSVYLKNFKKTNFTTEKFLKSNAEKINENKKLLKELLKYSVPITLIGIIIPVSQVADSFIIVNALKTYRTDATALFGLLSGVACTITNLPVSVCYGVASVAIPAVSESSDKEQKYKNALKTLCLTVAVALPSAAACFFFSPYIVKILFSSLSGYEQNVAIKLIKILSCGTFLLSVLQTTDAVLIGYGKTYRPIIGISVGVTVKIIVEIFLIKNQNINIYGGAVALIACYFISDLINLISLNKERCAYGNKKHKYRAVADTQ